MKKAFQIAVVLLLIAVVVRVSISAEANIALKGYTPRMVAEDTTGYIDRVSTGLTNVGVGSKVYLTGNEGETGISSYSWMLARPAGSSAALSSATAPNPTFMADVLGTYRVTLTVTDSSGTSPADTVFVNAANYCGVGTVEGGGPNYPQCALCHADKEAEWDLTGHAHFMQERLTNGPAYYGASCIECHTVGYDENPAAVNDGFDDRAETDGWSFPSPFTPGIENWNNLVNNYPEVAALANIQCENCHGPGSAHGGVTSNSKMVSSLISSTCGVCHDEPPYHEIYMQYETSQHANATSEPTGSGHSSCVKCHSGLGFVEYLDTGDSTNVDYMPITCGTCHDPHSSQNSFQLRTLDNITLGNGEVLTGGGLGKLCMNCHKSRRDAETYAPVYHSNFGPHYGTQADVLAGTNAITYGQPIPSSPHYDAVADACVSCHMSEPAAGGENQMGQHTWRMSSDNGTPEDPADDLDNVTGCLDCHSGISSFEDILADDDWDGDGTTESVIAEVDGLIENLGLLLPPDGPTVEVTADYTTDQLLAAYNYKTAVMDGSHGVHNADWISGLLQESIDHLTGVIAKINAPLPQQFALHQNFPNPFNPSTMIRFEVARPALVKIAVYNLGGQMVARLVNQTMEPGSYQVPFNGDLLSSGIYMALLEAENMQLRQKMILIK